MISPVDIAAVAVEALAPGRHDGRIYDLTGPELLSYGDALNRIGCALGRTLQFVDMPEDAWREAMLKAGSPEALVAVTARWYAAVRNGQMQVASGVADVLGRRGQTLDEWLAARERRARDGERPSLTGLAQRAMDERARAFDTDGMWSGWVMVLFAVTVSSVGCGSSDSDSPIDCTNGCWQPSDADEQLFTDICALIEPCCVTNAYRDASDIEGCKKSYRSSGVTRDASVRKACLDELKSLAGAGKNCVPEIWNLSGPCERLLYEPSGPQQPGDPCKNRADCAGAPGTVTFCNAVSRDVSPTGAACLRLSPGKAGASEPCLGDASRDGIIVAAARTVATSQVPISTGAVCERSKGLYCGPGNDPTSWTCQAQGAGGSMCVADVMCASGQCSPPDGTFASSEHPGTCTKQVSTGQTCDDYYSGAPLTLCDAATYCEEHDMAGTCMPKLPAGSACKNPQMCLSDNCDDTNVCSTQTAAERTALLGFCWRL